ncbi:MAG TPA: helix-turn-helix domain-containing protein [Nitrospira sp.]|nr:helix-turn-helix domain-containing protein [Nitrospira sp.]
MDGKELRRRRDQMKLTQVELAEELGVTSNTVARYERDELAIPEPVARLTVLIQKLKAEKRRRP